MKIAKKSISFITKTSNKYIYNKVYTSYKDLEKDIASIKNNIKVENDNKDIAESVKESNNKIVARLDKILENHKESKLVYIVSNIVKMYIDKDNTMYCDAVFCESVSQRFALDIESIKIIGQSGDDVPSDDIKNIVALCNKK